MTRKKNKGWTFIFSLIPGAGEMYMGFMKQGVSTMGLFFALIAVGACLNIGPILFVLPIVWCYSFFSVHNMRGLSDEEFYALEDDYVFHLDRILPTEKLSKKQNKILAVILIVTGICILWNRLIDWCHEVLYSLIPTRIATMITGILYAAPQIVIALVLIVIGIHLIKGKKVELDNEETEEK